MSGVTGHNGSHRAGALELLSIVESERAHLRRFFFRRLRRRGVLLVSPLCKGVARFPCSFRAVAATLAPVSPSAWLLPCTGGLVRAPAPGPVVAGSSLHTATPPRAASSSARSVRDRGQSPVQPAPDSPWNGNNSTPSTNHVSTVETYSALRGYDGTIRVQSPSPFSHSSLSSATLRATEESGTVTEDAALGVLSTLRALHSARHSVTVLPTFAHHRTERIESFTGTHLFRTISGARTRTRTREREREPQPSGLPMKKNKK